MRIIHRYIFLDLLAAFGLSLLALNVVMMTDTVMRTAFVFSKVGASASDMAMVVLLVQPQAAVYTIPLALMVAILLTYGRMNASSEMAVLRTSGMSLGALSLPALMLAGMCLVLGLALSCFVAPASAKKSNDLIRSVLATRAPNAINEGVFTSTFSDMMIFVEKKTSSGALEGVFLHDGRNPRRPSTLTARRGKADSPDGRELRLELEDGSMHVGGLGSATDITFDRYVMKIPIEAKVTKTPLVTAEMTPADMLLEARRLKTSVPQDYMYIIRAFHRRFTLPLMSICVALFSVPLSFRAGKTGKLGGVGMGLGVVVAFYVLSSVLESMFKAGSIHHAVAGWFPLAALMAFSVFLYRREAGR